MEKWKYQIIIDLTDFSLFNSRSTYPNQSFAASQSCDFVNHRSDDTFGLYVTDANTCIHIK
jgi:hypothetical protein